MITRIILTLVLLCSTLSAATLNVATTGSDSYTYAQAQNPATPWRTIYYASLQVNPGDTVNIAAGTYYEEVYLTRSGTAALPITWNGARGGGGEWLTIINGSTDITSGWVSASEVATGVFKRTSVPFTPHRLIVDDETVILVTPARLSINLTPASGATAVVDTGYITATRPYWDGIEAIACYVNPTLYLRFRDNSAPSTHSVRISNNNASENQPLRAPIFVTADYQIIQNLDVRGGPSAIALRGVGAEIPINNLIRNNWLHHGAWTVGLADGAASNTVSDNVITGERYNFPGVPGGWSGYTSRPDVFNSNVHYAMTKNWTTYKESSAGVTLRLPGNGNLITGNTITNGGLGINVMYARSPGTLALGTVICSNYIADTSSYAMLAWGAATGTQWHDNVGKNNGGGFRLHNWGEVEEGTTVDYFYRNKLAGNGCGDGVYWHCELADFSATMERRTAWFYHNSFSGYYWSLSVALAQYSTYDALTNVFFINNVFSDSIPFHLNDIALADAGLFRAFDYNLVRGTPAQANIPLFIVPHNIRADNYVWSPPLEADFNLPAGSPAISHGIPVHQPFTLGSTTYPALPGFTGVYYSGTTADMGAVPYNFIGTVTNVLSITCGAPLNVLLDSDPDAPDNVPPLFTISRANVDLVPNTFGDCPFTVSVSSPSGAVEGVDYSVFQTSGQIDDGQASVGSFVIVKSLRNLEYHEQRIVRVTIEPGAAYGISGTSYADVLLYNADPPPGVIIRPQPEPGHGMLPKIL